MGIFDGLSHLFAYLFATLRTKSTLYLVEGTALKWERHEGDFVVSTGGKN